MSLSSLSSTNLLYLHRPQFIHHKITPIRHPDGDPLTREDIQYDLLEAIFSNPLEVFTNPAYVLAAKNGKAPADMKQHITFGELYVNSILSSPKCTKVSKDKMIETPSFAVEFSKMCLLVNIGRINTTLACKGALRQDRPLR